MRGRLKRCRPSPGRLLAALLILLAFAVYCYYYTTSVTNYAKRKDNSAEDLDLKLKPNYNELARTEPVKLEVCEALDESTADIDTVVTYPKFEFQPSWLRTKEFWDKTFEHRYEKIRRDVRRPTLKVIVVPHSHNDPGWLRTFEQYFEWKTKNIISNMVNKLQQHKNMTFIWTEISFLNAWWERAHPTKQKALKKLINEGRLEITTGGWVMPDEACTHMYALIDQFIEGHQWVKTNLGIVPKTGWSIDPFGHGPTVPYLLDQSGLEGAIIQRIHYAWKQWFAEKQIEEFHWLPGWAGAPRPSLVVHNQPFDIYSIKSTCGPHPSVCLSYDFRKIPGEYSEYTSKHEEITDANLHAKSKTLVEEYERIGTLTPHNVVLVPLGDDFRYEYDVEFDAQYVNYMKMFNYINEHFEQFRAEVRFGTPRDYFDAVKERHGSVPTLKGDFFVYSDIFSEGKPAYWSGYYTTRPYLKILARQFEHQLRTAEILFTLISNHMKQTKDVRLLESEKRLDKSYEHLIDARRNLGLFQHHDAITGTSRASVMHDYGTKLFTSLYHCVRLQELALTSALLPDEHLHAQNLLQSETEWETYGKPVKKLHVSHVDRNKIVLFNSLMEPRTEVMTLNTNSSNIRIFDTDKDEYVLHQINPVMEVGADGRRLISNSSFDVVFVAQLDALTAVTFEVRRGAEQDARTVIFCNHCGDSAGDAFATKRMMPGDIQLENTVLKLLINRNTGFLRQVYRKDINKRNVVEMQFGAYQSAQRHSGAYLFMPNYDSPERNVLGSYSNWNTQQDDHIIIISGAVCTEIVTMYMPFLLHSLKIFNVDEPTLARAIYVENTVDFESPPKNRETELFMRVQTDIQNGNVPEFYTDQNGFQYQKRVKVEKLGIEGNYYPITTMAWLQDEETRLTLLTDHAQGAAAFEPGRLELMLDRRTLYDDFRGIGEGVVDNKPTVFRNWLLVEAVEPPAAASERAVPRQRLFNTERINFGQYELPTARAERLSRALNYPVNTYVVDGGGAAVTVRARLGLARHLPAGLHLVTLRTEMDAALDRSPAASALLVLHRPGRRCSAAAVARSSFLPGSSFAGLRVANVSAVSLTGLRTLRSLANLSEIRLKPMEVRTYKITF